MEIKISEVAFFALMEFFVAKTEKAHDCSVIWLCHGDKRVIRYATGDEYATISIDADTEKWLRSICVF